MIEVVGIGAAGWESLGSAERALVRGADLLVGGPRQLDLIPDASGQRRIPWPTDLRSAAATLLSDHATRTTVVLASGDPLVAGVGGTLIELFGSEVVRVHPAVSSVALARARMGWPAETVEVVRLRGADLDLLRRAVSPGRRLIVLSRDRHTPAEVAELLVAMGFGPSRLTVLNDLGAPSETRTSTLADAWSGPAGSLNVVGLECRPDPAGSPNGVWSLTPGLPDDTYEHDGQLTKRDVRAAALARLQPRPGELLWDVGAGAGSVAIEWMRTHQTCRAMAIERDPSRADRIARNARTLGVPGLSVTRGAAPEVLAELPTPDAVFIGGGASTATIDLSWNRLPARGRLVVHAVAYETETRVVEAWRRYGGELTRLSVEHLEPLGGLHGWKPARAVVLWHAIKVGPGSGPEDGPEDGPGSMAP